MKNDEYWQKKEQLTQLAKIHTRYMFQHYSKETQESELKSIIYSAGSARSTTTSCIPSLIKVQDIDTVSAIFAYTSQNKKKICVLNFASYKNPGGKFIEGSSAQEESLCHESNLYNVLIRFKDTWYSKHNQPGATNHSLYEDEALYTPNIIFKRGSQVVEADVLTCAAPNWTAANKYSHESIERNNYILKNRIKFIKGIMEEQKVDIAVLGAYGCGVFGQDPVTVASYFNEIFTNTTISSLVYAVPRGKGMNAATNYNSFKENIKERESR